MSNHYGYMYCAKCLTTQPFNNLQTRTWTDKNGARYIRDYITCSECGRYHYYRTRRFVNGVEVKAT